VVRFNDTVDLGRIGLAAARLAGSGIGIGLQGKGTALIHRRDLSPLANLELYSVAPAVTPELYRLLGANAARHAKGATPDPARNPYTDEAIEARYHTHGDRADGAGAGPGCGPERQRKNCLRRDCDDPARSPFRGCDEPARSPFRGAAMSPPDRSQRALR